MQMSNGARIRRGAVALAVAGVITLGGCTSTFTAQPYTPGVGTNTDLGETDALKLRGMVLVIDGEKAILTGSVVETMHNDSLTKISGVSLDEKGDPSGDLSFSEAKAELKPNQLVKLTEMKIVTDKGKLVPGYTAKLTFDFQNAGSTDLVVPVVDNSLPDYKDVKAS